MTTEASRDLIKPALLLSAALIVTGIILIIGFWFVMDRQAARLETAIQHMREGTSQSVERMSDQVSGALSKASQEASVRVQTPDALKIEGPSKDGALPTDVRLRDAGKDGRR